MIFAEVVLPTSKDTGVSGSMKVGKCIKGKEHACMIRKKKEQK